MNDSTVTAWLFDAGTIVAIALLAACGVYGILLAVFPRIALGVSAALNRRYSSRRALRPLEVPRYTERWFYRHHRAVAILLLAGVAAFFLLYAFHYPRDTLLAFISGRLDTLTGALVDTIEWFLVGANALIGVFALVMLLRPSLLKPVETWANRWISTRRALRDAENSREPLDDFVTRHPRVAGFFVLVGAGYIVLSLLLALGG